MQQIRRFWDFVSRWLRQCVFFLPLFDIFGKNAPETIARMQKILGGASLTHIPSFYTANMGKKLIQFDLCSIFLGIS